MPFDSAIFEVVKNPTPNRIAIQSAVLFAVYVSALLIFSVWLYSTYPNYWVLLCVAPLLTLAFTFFLFRYFMETFIYRKIKVIYKNIHKLKSPWDKLNISMDEDILGKVEEEVREYAISQANEKRQQHEMEAYRREFVGNVSHELKTPLFNVQGYVETLLDGGLEDIRINRQYLHKASKNLDRLNHIVEDLQTIYSIEGKSKNLEIRKFDMHLLTLEVFESLEMQADAGDVELSVKPGCNHPFMVNGDKDMIRQVMVNLVGNAIKYSKEEGGEVKVGFYDMDRHLLVEISDTGIGVEPEHIPRLFDRFYRVDKSRSRDIGGTGLGLSIVKHIIEAHDQTINVRSAPGVGSTFGFTIEKA